MTASDKDKIYMERAIYLAEKGIKTASPNPIVGCVIVKNDSIICEGFHEKYGGHHAEVNAINSVRDKSQLAGATVYVTLEPCSHKGKTPPCTNLLIESKVSRVVVAQKDINPKVNGTGINKLQKAGITVTVGICEEKAKHQNRRFNIYHRLKRPYILLKWAQTKDGYMARQDFVAHTDRQWISSPTSRLLSHRWRTEEAAILVGKTTVETDNPYLNARLWSEKHSPTRIIIDPAFSLTNTYHVFDGKQPAYHIGFDSEAKKPIVQHTDRQVVMQSLFEKNFLVALLEFLYSERILSVMVEGGSYTLQRFLEADIWDEARVFTSTVIRGGFCKAPQLSATAVSDTVVEGDVLRCYRLHH